MIDFETLFKQQIPLLDVRAPIEFSKGAFPSAINIPILNDEQRHLVGICYKEQGQAAAQTLGHQLVAESKNTTVKNWQHFIERHPNAVLYCFRGGDRSRIAQQWLAEAGTEITRVEGGFKALRSYLGDTLEAPTNVVLLSGKTGVGKTQLLPLVSHSIDLEGLANHRGSAFGKQRTPQPSQIDFENQLAIELMKQREYVVLEDESRLIGRINIPLTLQARMKQAPICLLEDTLENRATRIQQEYVTQPLFDAAAAGYSTDAALKQLHDELANSLSAIQKRLGGDRYNELKSSMQDAFDQHSLNNDSFHTHWISTLLRDYYDPMYDYQLSKKHDRIVQRLSWSDVDPDSELNFGSYAS